MNGTTLHALKRSLSAIAVAAIAAACANEAPVAVPSPGTPVAKLAADLTGCEKLAVEDGHKLAARLYAEGDQVYRWNGTSWALFAPDARLYPNANAAAVVGTHFGGPTWQSVSGSKVVAAAIDRCFADPNSIPWLLLGAVSSEGPGIFDGVTFIQRVNTTGGKAPEYAGTAIGEEKRVPYTAEYLFYRAK